MLSLSLKYLFVALGLAFVLVSSLFSFWLLFLVLLWTEFEGPFLSVFFAKSDSTVKVTRRARRRFITSIEIIGMHLIEYNLGHIRVIVSSREVFLRVFFLFTFPSPTKFNFTLKYFSYSLPGWWITCARLLSLSAYINNQYWEPNKEDPTTSGNGTTQLNSSRFFFSVSPPTTLSMQARVQWPCSHLLGHKKDWSATNCFNYLLDNMKKGILTAHAHRSL